MTPVVETPECSVTTMVSFSDFKHTNLTSSTEMKPKRNERQGTLSFDLTKNEFRYIPKLCELSEEDIEARWHGFFDYEIIKRRNRALAKHMACATFPYDKAGIYTLRGLDSLFKENMETRKKQRALASATLANEQERQKKEGIHDAESIARLMHEATLASTVMAIEMGKRDVEALVTGEHGEQQLRCHSDDELQVPTVQIVPSKSAPTEGNASIDLTSPTSPKKRKSQSYLKRLWGKTRISI
jgi:hypothetical protein